MGLGDIFGGNSTDSEDTENSNNPTLKDLLGEDADNEEEQSTKSDKSGQHTHGELIKRMQHIDPYEFKEFVAELWSLVGYETTVSQSSNDMGVDVIAEQQSAGVSQKLGVQVKRYSGIEPVRDRRRWEPDDLPEATSRGEIVERLLEQASQHVDIHKVFLDREFDSKHVRDAAYSEDLTYVLGKKNLSEVDEERIEELKEDDVYDSKIGHGSVTYDGRTHDMTYVYKPTDIDGEEYTIFTIPEHVDHHRAEGLIKQYAQRMEIEVQYRTIKNNFLPTCASTDYEMRFLFFVIGALLYNVWRLANFCLRDEVSVNLGEDPPIQAGEIVELAAFFLFEHG